MCNVQLCVEEELFRVKMLNFALKLVIIFNNAEW